MAAVSSELWWYTGKGETASEKVAAPVLFQLMESNYKTAADDHAGKAEADSALNRRVGNLIVSFLRNPSKGARPARWEPSELQLALGTKMEEFARNWWLNGVCKGHLYKTLCLFVLNEGSRIVYTSNKESICLQPAGLFFSLIIVNDLKDD